AMVQGDGRPVNAGAGATSASRRTDALGEAPNPLIELGGRERAERQGGGARPPPPGGRREGARGVSSGCCGPGPPPRGGRARRGGGGGRKRRRWGRVVWAWGISRSIAARQASRRGA